MIEHLLAGVVWAVVGAGVGAATRWGSVWLAGAEGLEPGSRPWQVYGPPVTTAVLFGVFAGVLGPVPLLLLRSLWVAVFVQIIYFDFEHRLILDRIMYPSMLLALGLSFFTPHLGILLAVVTGLATGVLFLLLALLGSVVFRTEALGFGDVKLACLIGLVAGGLNAAAALWYGTVLAGLVSIILVVFRLRKMRDSIAYGPFLAAGTLIVLFQLSLPPGK